MTNEEAIAYFKEHNKNLVSVAKDENVYDHEKQIIETYCMRRTFEANEKAIKALEQQPKVGRWIKVITNVDEWGETWHFKCSICGEKSNKGYRPLENYCHNCGAKMEGEEYEVSG